MKTPYVWVVEALFKGHRIWLPTRDMALTKEQAKEQTRWWSNDNSVDKYRIRKYVREKE